MPATPRDVTYEADDLVRKGGYGHIECPGYHNAELIDVNDHISRAGNEGWKWDFEVLGAPFSEYTMFSTDARWKLVQTVAAFDPNYWEDGGTVENVDPNVFIGMTVSAFIGWQYDEDELEEGDMNYRELKFVESLETAAQQDAAAAEEASDVQPI